MQQFKIHFEDETSSGTVLDIIVGWNFSKIFWN